MPKNIYKQLRLPLMAVFLALAGKTPAQEVILEQSFKYDGTGYPEVPSNDSRYPDWIFSNCYDAQGSYLQIGGNGNIGTVQTPPLTTHKDYAIANIEVYNYSNTERSFNIKGTDCTVSRTDNYLLKENRSMRISFILSDFGPNPYFTIEPVNADSPIELKYVKVQNIGHKLFFESFDKISITNGGEFVDNGYRPESSMYNNPTYPFVFSGNQCILLYQTANHYLSPNITTTPNKCYILSFRAAGNKYASASNPLTVNCSGATLSETSFQLDKESWQYYHTIVTATSSSIQLSFSGQNHLLDDVLITEAPTITLDQSANNSAVINHDLGQLRTVQLQRTLTAGIWNTLCLPFEVSKDIIAKALGSGSAPEVQTLTSISEGIFNFAPNEGTVTAGTPFLLKVSQTVTNPTFSSVVIQQSEPQQLPVGDATGYKLAGIYSPTTLSTDGTNLFLGTDGYLYAPADGSNTINGLRAYFIVPSGGSARVQHTEGSAVAGITTATADSMPTYDLTGRRLTGSPRQQGIYIRGGRKYIVK